MKTQWFPVKLYSLIMPQTFFPDCLTSWRSICIHPEKILIVFDTIYIKAWNSQYNSAWCNLYKSFEYSSGMCEAYYQSLEEGLICFECWSKNNFLGNNFHLASGSNNTLLKMQLVLTGWLCSNLACVYLLTELYLWKTDSDFSRQKSNFFQSSYSKFLTYLISYQLKSLEHYQFILWQ